MEGTLTMQRFIGISVGILVQVLFAVTSYYNVIFLLGTPPRSGPWSMGLDALLALQFVVVHSLLLAPGVRKKLESWIPSTFYGLFFCATACLTLALTMSLWQVADWAIWQLTGWPRLVVQTMNLSCWGTLFYSLCCSGFGFHTGWLPWWYWVRQQPMPRRPFNPHGAFAIIRHPGYMSFLGLTWFTPDMTPDRAVLVVILTAYIFVGSYLKELRMIYYIGNDYREYCTRVPGYVRWPRPSWSMFTSKSSLSEVTRRIGGSPLQRPYAPSNSIPSNANLGEHRIARFRQAERTSVETAHR
jgi:protein-S-isoprenylcysteine O-methyltransferase Ste14